MGKIRNLDGGVQRIGYFIWCESLLSDIIKTQVFSIMDEISKDGSVDIKVFHFCPTSGVDIELEKIRLKNPRLSIHRLKFFVFPKKIPLIFPTWWSSPIVFTISFFCMAFSIVKYRLTVLHIRAYPLAIAACAIKFLYPKIRVVFDTRSPFPEENVTMGRWARDSLSFSMWKWIEKKSFKSLDSIVFTSNEQAKSHGGNSCHPKFKIIRNNSANSNYYRSLFDLINKAKISSAKECFIYSYVGSAEKNGWNRPGPYVNFIKILMSLPMRSMVVFITNSASIFRTELEAAGIDKEFYRIYSCDPDKVSEYLSECHAGLNFMTSVDTRMSIKTAEYFGNGIPVICNSNVRGCVELIEAGRAGIVLQEGNEKEQLTHFMDNYPEYQARASVMSELFSVECISNNYIDVYKSI
jgi:glycosyltransferase involved in cell wall biosynthesis